jgi:hypothetical protein
MNQHLLDASNSTLDGDEWGNVQAWRFATAHVLEHMNECPDEWHFHHALCFTEDFNASESFEEEEISYLLADELVTVQDLIVFGDMLNILRDILVTEGKDY